MWKPEWSFGFDAVADGKSAAILYDPDCYKTLLTEAEFEGISRERLVTGSPMHDDSLTHAQRIRRNEFMNFVNSGHGPLYLCHPELFEAYASSNKYGTDVSQHGAKRIFELFFVRRGMPTPMTLPDGSETSMGDGIAPLEIVTIELVPSDANRTLLADHIGKLQDKLLSLVDVGLPEVLPGSRKMALLKTTSLLYTSIRCSCSIWFCLLRLVKLLDFNCML